MKDQVGSLSSFLLYAAYFLPTSVNAAWLSVATSIGALIVPVSYKPQASLDAAAVVLAVLIVAAGEAPCTAQFGQTLVTQSLLEALAPKVPCSWLYMFQTKTLYCPAGLWATCWEKDSAYGLTLVWSFVAVYGQPHSKTVHAAALGATVTMCIASILSVLRRRGQPSSDLVNVADMRQPLKSSPRAQTIPA